MHPRGLWIWQFSAASLRHKINFLCISGFSVNFVTTSFKMLSASSHYGLTEVRLEFLMSFPDVVVASDEIVLLAPRGFSFSEIGEFIFMFIWSAVLFLGKEECRDYALISHEGVSPSTALDRSPPVCSANMISWTILEGALFASVRIDGFARGCFSW